MSTTQRELELSRAAPGQAAELNALAWAAQASHGYGPERLQAWSAIHAITDDTVSTHPIWIARWDGILAGWGATMAWGRRCRLEHLWIAPGHQRQGIGRLLLGHLASEAHVAGWRELEIVSEPLAAGFYQRCGAEPAGEEVSPEGFRLPVFLLDL